MSQAQSRKQVSVGWLMPGVAHYRVPVINKLNESQKLKLRVYAGQAFSGIGVDEANEQIVGSLIWVRNVLLSRRDPRVLYVVGWVRMIADGCRVIIITEASHNLTNWLLLSARVFTGQRIVVMGHIRPWQGTTRLARRLRRTLVRRADAVIAYTDEGMNQALGWGVRPDRVIGIGNSLDLERIEQAQSKAGRREIQDLRIEHKLGDLPVFLFVGRTTKAKRLDLAIAAVLELEETDTPVNLIVVGSGPELSMYQQQARGSERVIFLGALLEEERLARYFALCEAVIIPGAVGLAVNHAFAYGRPLITSKYAPHGPEIVLATDRVNSVMVEDQCSSLFAATLRQLVNHPDFFRQLQDGASRTVVPSIDTMVIRIESMINQLALADT